MSVFIRRAHVVDIEIINEAPKVDSNYFDSFHAAFCTQQKRSYPHVRLTMVNKNVHFQEFEQDTFGTREIIMNDWLKTNFFNAIYDNDSGQKSDWIELIKINRNEESAT